MFAVYFLAAVALASAAPHYNYPHREDFHHHDHHDFPSAFSNSFRDDMFDTRNFWIGLADEMHRIDDMLTDFTKHFPVSTSSEGIEGNEYIITISLPGFEEKGIVVKAREGVLMIQARANTEDGNQRSYLDLRTLPTNINVAGSWTYDKGVLKVVFPITKDSESVTVRPSDATDEPEVQQVHSREEMDNNNENSNQDADIGVENERGDRDREILTNIIPTERTIEATTYAVDLDNEVEFVPVRYNRD